MKKAFAAFLLFALIIPIETSAVTHPLFGAKLITLRTTAGTRYTPLFGGALNDSNTVRQPLGVGGTVSNLTAQVTAAPGVGNSYVVSLYKNNVITDLTCTIADAATSCTDTTHSVAAEAGDDLAWGTATVGTTGASQVTIAGKFDAHSVLAAHIGGSTNGNATADGYYNLLGGSVNETESNVTVIAPIAFTLDKLYCRASSNPGTGESWTLTLYHNGSPTAVSCTIAGAETTASDLTDSISVVAGDTLSMFFDESAAPSSRYQNWGMRLIPETSGEYPIMSASTGVISTSMQQYANPSQTGAGYSNETSGHRVSPLAFTWRKLYAFFNPAPGSGNGWTVKSRNAFADANQSVTISNTAQTGQDTTNSDSVALGDSIAMSTLASGSPTTVVTSKFSSVSYVAPAGSPLLLDTIPVPTFAFSLSRYLRAAEVGNAVARFRESATGNQLDFKLNGSNVLVSDDANEYTVSEWMALTSATTTYVVSVYDQSGNGRTFTAPAQENEPILVQNSDLNGLAALGFTGAEYRLESASMTITPASGIEVHALVTPQGTLGATERYVFGNGAVSLAQVGVDSGGWFWQADLGEMLFSSTIPVTGTDYQMAWRFDGNLQFVINQNGTEILDETNAEIADWRTGSQIIGNSSSVSADRYWDGLIAELIFINSVYTTSEVDAIELSMQTHGGLVTESAPASLPYRVYNLGKMLLNGGTFILQ